MGERQVRARNARPYLSPPLTRFLRRYDCTPSERLSAEQNCEVLISATEYYKKQVSEPAGSQASWNTRDQHMTTTLLRIRAHLGEDTKIV